RWTGSGDGADAYLRVKGAKALAPRQLATLRALYRWREEVAAQADTATFRIIGNDALLAVSKALPETHEALGRVSGLPAVLGRRHGEALLAATREGLTLPEAQLPRIERTARPPKDPEIDVRHTLERPHHLVHVVRDHRPGWAPR